MHGVSQRNCPAKLDGFCIAKVGNPLKPYSFVKAMLGTDVRYPSEKRCWVMPWDEQKLVGKRYFDNAKGVLVEGNERP